MYNKKELEIESDRQTYMENSEGKMMDWAKEQRRGGFTKKKNE